MRLGFSAEDLDVNWVMRAVDREDERVLRICAIHLTESAKQFTYEEPGDLIQLLPSTGHHGPAARAVANLRDSIYVTAVRQVETDIFPAPEDPTPTHADVGSCGEYAP